MSVSVVDGLEAIEVDQSEREWLAGLRSGPDPVGEEPLKAAPVGQTGQIVGQRDSHRRLPRLLGGALLLGDEEARAHDLGEHAKILAEHADDEGGGDGDQRRERERQLGPARQECDDKRRGRGDDDNARFPRHHVETNGADRGDDPDGGERESEFDRAVLPGRERRHENEHEGQRRPENAGGAEPAPDNVGRLKLHPVSSLEPGQEPKGGHGDERGRQEDSVEERAGRRGPGEQRQSGQNDDPVDIGPKPRQRAILLAQERRGEVRLGGLRRPPPRRRRRFRKATRRLWSFA